MSEKALTDRVMQFARWHDWLAYHTWRSVHSPAGFPDCVFVRPATYSVGAVGHGSGCHCQHYAPRLIVAELKSSRGKTTPEQDAWLAALRAAGVPCYVWTPADWAQIEEVLGDA